MDGSPSAPSQIAQEVEGLKQTCTMLSHQLAMIMGALHVPKCACGVCQEYTQEKQNTQRENGSACKMQVDHPMETMAAAPRAASETPNEMPCIAHDGECWPLQIVKEGMTSGEPTDSELAASQLLSQLFPGAIPNINNLSSFAALADQLKPCIPAPSTGGRKSKYCTPEEKKQVAEYAQMHGAAAAARRFGIPPSVAAYYQRKEYRHNKVIPHNVFLPGMTGTATPRTPDAESDNGERHTPMTPATPLINELMMKVEKPTGTPHTPTSNFLRGRGRGRPKLIGDELDAALVDYMVKVKQADPRGHLTASQALEIARQYILAKAPGLLEEHGGQIKLKLTWAMKLVSRIAERQKEIELGLPAGSLSNISRANLASLPGGSLMADMMAQNILSQHMNNIMTQIGAGQPTNTPEITNVKELNLNLKNEGEGSEEGNEEQFDEGEVDSPEGAENLRAMESSMNGHPPSFVFANTAF